jgi:hypothetical protein
MQQATTQARGQVRDQIDQRSTDAGQRISSQAGDLRAVSEQLRGQGKEGPAKVADQAAERIERIGGWLTESDADTILADVEDFARRNPWAVVAGGIAVGFAASRFLKASSSDRYHSRDALPPSRRLPERATSEQRFSRDLTPPAPSVPPVHGASADAPPMGMGSTVPGTGTAAPSPTVGQTTTPPAPGSPPRTVVPPTTVPERP